MIIMTRNKDSMKDTNTVPGQKPGTVFQLVKEGGNKRGEEPYFCRKKSERRMKRRKASGGEGGVKPAF